jgi:uncharacterized membrane protein
MITENLDNCPECTPIYGAILVIVLFTIVYVVFRILLICYIHNDDILDNYTDTSTDSANAGNDIMLPKYTHFDELTEDEIQYTLPPVYNEENDISN